MVLIKKGVDVFTTNRLKTDIRVVNNAQVWSEQIRGAYHFLYPHIIKDFSHTDDINQWIKVFFDNHDHNHRKGPTTGVLPIFRFSSISSKAGKSWLKFNIVLGKIRRGLSRARELIFGINKTNQERV